jgi:hypothetical protein
MAIVRTSGRYRGTGQMSDSVNDWREWFRKQHDARKNGLRIARRSDVPVLSPAQQAAMDKLAERGQLTTGSARLSTVKALARLGLVELTTESHMHVNAYSHKRTYVTEWIAKPVESSC